VGAALAAISPAYTASKPGGFDILMARFAALYFGLQSPHARRPYGLCRGLLAVCVLERRVQRCDAGR